MVIEYLKTPPSRSEVESMLKAMGLTARELLRTNVEPYKLHNLGDANKTESDIIDAMMEDPVLINRPIVITSKGTKLCRPSEVVLELLTRPQQGEFSKEDGQKVVDSAGVRVS